MVRCVRAGHSRYLFDSTSLSTTAHFESVGQYRLQLLAKHGDLETIEWVDVIV